MMAMSHEDVEVWLPAEFLTEEELLLDQRNLRGTGLNAEFKTCLSFPTEFPYEFDSFVSKSALSSPIDSVMGSIETDSSSDEDDFLAGLTRRLTQQLVVKPELNKWVTAGSPESTPSGIGSWSASSNGSRNGELSPSATHFEAKNNTLDLIYAATSEVARLKMTSDVQNYSNQQERGMLFSSRTQNAGTAAIFQNAGFFSSQSHGHCFSQMNQTQVMQDHVPRLQFSSIQGRQQSKAGWQAQSLFDHQQQQTFHVHNSERSVGHENLKSVRPLCMPQSACSSLQMLTNQQQRQHHHPLPQQTNSGTRVVSLRGSGVKRECTGTGVFLPRRYGNPTDSKKNPVCSTVLPPTEAVRAINLNFDDLNMTNHAQHRFNGASSSNYDVLMARRNALLAQQRRRLHLEGALKNHDPRLPEEWTCWPINDCHSSGFLSW